MVPLVDPALENVHPEIAIFGREIALADLLDQAFAAQPLRDQLLDRDHLQAEPTAEFDELGQALHRAVLVHQFAQNPGGWQAREEGEIHGRLRVPGPLKHPAGFGAQRKDMARLHQLFGLRRGSARILIVTERS